MAVHVAIVRLVNVDAVGNIVDKSTATIGEVMKAAGTAQRVFESESGSAPNASAQSVTQYLIDEDAAGFNLLHMDQTYIVTSDV
jgi:hypothetical protein